MSDMKMTRGGITFGPGGDAPDRIREMLARIPSLPHGKAAQDEVLRLRRRVAALERRLRWALEELDAEKAAFDAHAGLGRRPRGRVWSGKRGTR